MVSRLCVTQNNDRSLHKAVAVAIAIAAAVAGEIERTFVFIMEAT
jgi:hypothetical protein